MARRDEPNWPKPDEMGFARDLWYKERDQAADVRKYLHMSDRVDAEVSGEMLTFEHETHSLKIVHEGGGFLTINIRDRKTQKLLQTRIPKFAHARAKGIERRSTYRFKDAGRLSFLAVMPDLLRTP